MHLVPSTDSYLRLSLALPDLLASINHIYNLSEVIIHTRVGETVVYIASRQTLRRYITLLEN
jgi:hypothetical protein